MISPDGLAMLVYPALCLTIITPILLIALLIKDNKDDQIW